MRLSFGRALALSLALHGALYGAGLGWMHWRESAGGFQIDLGGSSLLPLPANMGGRRPTKAPEDWVFGDGRKLAPLPQALSYTATAEEDGPAGPPCPPPCPSNAGDWVPAGQTAKAPKLPDGFFTDADYPRDAKNRSQSGKLMVEVLIDVTGEVRDVRLLQGSHEALNKVVMEKLWKAKFRPAYDATGAPIPCRMTLPFSFELD
jgi:TonB family protein